MLGLASVVIGPKGIVYRTPSILVIGITVVCSLFEL